MPTYHKITLVLTGLLLIVTLSISGLLLFAFDSKEGITLDYDDIQFGPDKKTAEAVIEITTDEIQSIADKGVFLVIPPVNANWYQVTFNEKLIGQGGNQSLKTYIEKYTGVFSISACSIQSQNQIKIFLKSNNDIQLSSNHHPKLYEATKLNCFLFLERTVRNGIIHLAMGIMMAGFCIFLLLYFAENKSRVFLIYSIASMMGSISLLSGLDFIYLPLTVLTFNKIICIAFMVLVMCVIAYAELIDVKVKTMYKLLYMVMALLMMVTIGLPTMESYKKFVIYRDIANLLVINLCGVRIITYILSKKQWTDKLVDLMLLVPIGILSFIAVGCEREIISSFAFAFMELYFLKIIVDEIIKNKEHLDELKLNTTMMKKKVERDNLTGLYNQQAILKKVDEAEGGTSIVIIDIDELKQINDRFGHNVGTKSIALIGEALMQFFSEDKIGRYGGDEFILISKNSTLRVANQLKDTNKWIKQEGKLIHPELILTISGGVTEKKKGMTAEEVLEEADQLLYDAKTSGRNCVMH